MLVDIPHSIATSFHRKDLSSSETNPDSQRLFTLIGCIFPDGVVDWLMNFHCREGE